MPAICATPALVQYVTTPANFSEQPQVRRVSRGFWRRLALKMSSHPEQTPQARYVPAYQVQRAFEAPLDRSMREHPSLSLYALAII